MTEPTGSNAPWPVASLTNRSKSSKSSKPTKTASPNARGRRHAADLEQTIDQVDGASPGPAPGEQVLFCKLLRDGILKHFNPWKLGDLQCILELRCFKGLLSDDDLKHFFESSVLGPCKFALGDLRGSESLDGLKIRVGEAHRGVNSWRYDPYPPHLTDVRSLTTKEAVLREYKMLTYVPTEVYKVAVHGAHVLREVGRLGLVDGRGAVDTTIDTTIVDENTATRYLSLACRAGLPASVVSRLVTACPSADVRDAIVQAAQGNHLDLIDLLVERHGAEVPWDCLLCVVDTADVETVRYLVEQGADIRNHDDDGGTLLYQAAGKGNLDVARFLVEEHGADVHARQIDGRTVLHDAAERGNLDMVRFLVDEGGADVHAKDDLGASVLHDAAERGNLDLVRFLVDEHGADVHAKDDKGATVLHMAAWNGKLDVVRYLVERGADVHAKNDNGYTVLHRAAFWGKLDLVRFLVDEHGADVHAKNGDGTTVLHDAAWSGKLDVVRFLVDEHGADVHARDDFGDSVLHSATDPSCEAFLRDRLERNAPRKRKTLTSGEAC